jgi:DNA polymerase-3 subunit delta'
MDLALHPLTKKQMSAANGSYSHAFLIVGPNGIGKHTLAIQLATDLLKTTGFIENQSVLIIGEDLTQSITIEEVRRLNHFLKLKVVGNNQINRVVIIENAQTMGMEAQNALLKTLEEPPLGSVIIMTANSEQSLLATLRSRLRLMYIARPSKDQLRVAFKNLSDAEFDRAYAISAGLPGHIGALSTDENHTLNQAAKLAREILTKTTPQRLALIDSLSKDKLLTLSVLNMLQQMADASLSIDKPKNPKLWQRIMQNSYLASDGIYKNAQPKLVLTQLMLSI